MKLSDYDPRNQPHSTQLAMTAIMGGMFVWCCIANMGSSLPELIFIDMPVHLGIAAAACIILMTMNNLMAKGSAHCTELKLAEVFAAHGFGTETAELLRRKVPAPTERNKVLLTFHLVMAGQYAQAKEQIAGLSAGQLPLRERAMLITARLLLFIDTGAYEKAFLLAEESQMMLENAYRAAPEFGEEFCGYADDYLEYLMLSAVMSELRQAPEQAAEYRQQAIRRAEKRTAEEALFYRSLTELQRLYITGAAEAAAEQAAKLLHTVSGLTPPVTAGAKRSMQRAVEQAGHLAGLRTSVRTVSRGRSLPQ